METMRLSFVYTIYFKSLADFIMIYYETKSEAL